MFKRFDKPVRVLVEGFMDNRNKMIGFWAIRDSVAISESGYHYDLTSGKCLESKNLKLTKAGLEALRGAAEYGEILK